MENRENDGRQNNLDDLFGEQSQMQTVSPLNAKTGGIAYSVLVGFYCIAVLIATIVTAAAANVIMAKNGYDNIEAALADVQKTDAVIYLNYLLIPVIIALCVLFITKRNKINLLSLVPVKCQLKYYAIAVLLAFGLLFSVSYINVASIEFFKLFGYKEKPASAYFPDFAGAKAIPVFIVIAVLPAIFEELMFRGLILNTCKNSLGSVTAILISAFCFSLFHASPEQTVYQFICGCAFALIAVRSGSILPSVLMHFINNALIVIFTASGAFDESGNLSVSGGGLIVLIVLSAISFIAASALLILDKSPLQKREKGQAKVFFTYASLGIGVLGLIWMLSLFGVS